MNSFQEDYGNIRQLLANHRIYSSLPENDEGLIISCTSGSGPGDNYMSIVKRIKISLTPQSTEQQNNKYVSLIIKRPVLAANRRKLFRFIDVFCNEIHAYNIVLPYLQKFLHSPQNLIFPECYFAGQDSHNDIIILEDLRENGFKLFNREISMDLNFCKAVMKQLARFHATSLVAQALDADGFQKQRESLLDVVYSPEAEYLYTKLLRSSLAIALFSLVKSNTDSALNEPIDLVRRLYGKVFKCMRQCVLRTAEARNVICHGDLWVNNIMVSERVNANANAKSTPPQIDIKFVDFQAMRYGSPVFDILHVIYTGTRRDLRESHIETILETYCTTLAHILHSSLSTIAPDALRTFQDSFSLTNVFDEYNNSKYIYGFGVSMWILPAVTFDSNNLPNLDEIAREPCSDEQMINKIKEKLTERYHDRMKETTLEFYENGCLQALVNEMQESLESTKSMKVDEINMELIYEEVRSLHQTTASASKSRDFSDETNSHFQDNVKSS